MERWVKAGVLTVWALACVCLIGCGAYDSPANVDKSAGHGLDRLGADPQAMPTDGLVAYWPFDGNAIDETGNGNDGVVHGAILTEDRCGRPNSAYRFDGIDDCIEVPHDASLNFGTGDLTVCCWVFMDQLPAQDVRIVGKFARDRTGPVHGDGYGYTLVVWANGIARAGIGEAGTGAAVSSLSPLDTGRWYFLTGVRANGELWLYVNGEVQGSIPNPRNGDNEASLEIGACKTDISDVRWFPGCLDDIRIFSRALSDDEIAVLMERCWTQVVIDIRPGSDVNPVNPRSGGLIPVAILTTSTAAGEPLDFDAATVDPLSVRCGPGAAAETHGKGHLEDIDGDGDIDLLLHFRTEDAGIVCGHTECGVIGETLSGEMIRGVDSIITVGCE